MPNTMSTALQTMSAGKDAERTRDKDTCDIWRPVEAAGHRQSGQSEEDVNGVIAQGIKAAAGKYLVGLYAELQETA